MDDGRAEWKASSMDAKQVDGKVDLMAAQMAEMRAIEWAA